MEALTEKIFEAIKGSEECFKHKPQQILARSNSPIFTLTLSNPGDHLYSITLRVQAAKAITLIDDKFEIFQYLENQLWHIYQEYFNDDPCDFAYAYNSDHLSDKLILYCKMY